MPELKIPNFNNKSRQYLFKNKLTIKRKSKSKLLNESIIMLISSFLLFYLNYLIPKKEFYIYSFIDNIYKIYINFLNFFKYFYQIILVFIIMFTLLLAILLIIGAFYRLYKISRRKTKKINF
tara:strand:- start:1497 stop:1862 length:366 start_codon:yes stop_codon:yes gene_type:complete